MNDRLLSVPVPLAAFPLTSGRGSSGVVRFSFSQVRGSRESPAGRRACESDRPPCHVAAHT